MALNGNAGSLATEPHTQYQSIGPSELEEQVNKKNVILGIILCLHLLFFLWEDRTLLPTLQWSNRTAKHG